MSYKTILVHADFDIAAVKRIRLAAGLARRLDAHLVGSAPSGVSRFLQPSAAVAGGIVAQRCRTMREEALQALGWFEALARQEGVLSSETRLIDDDLDGGLAVQARYCDLAVVGQADPALPDPCKSADLPEYLALHSGRPVLVLPYSGAHRDLDGEAIVAWDGSVQAARAVAAAVPLLQMARHTTVVGFAGAGEAARGVAVQPPAVELAAWLARHGVVAQGVRRRAAGDVGAALLTEAGERGASLLVMGAYGHGQLRERLVGGTTAHVLRSMTLPVLFAH